MCYARMIVSGKKIRFQRRVQHLKRWLKNENVGQFAGLVHIYATGSATIRETFYNAHARAVIAAGFRFPGALPRNIYMVY